MNLHTEQTLPYITLKTLEKNTRFDIKPGTLKREFLDNTHNAHGYHCQPLTTANLHGWDFVLKTDVEVIWDGVYSTESDHVKITSGGILEDGTPIANTLTANATISFDLGVTIETDSNHYCFFMGPTNYFIKGAKPMSALIRTDWYKNTSLQFCWQITTPNKPVLFKKGTPILSLINYPKNLIENTVFSVKETSLNEKEAMGKYNNERQEYYKKNPGKFPNLYRKGIDSLTDTANKFLDKPFKPNPSEIKYE
jgi:Family of unknown function (DUF6065)